MVGLRDILMAPALFPAALLFKNKQACRRLGHVLRPLLTHVVNQYGLRAAARAGSQFGVVHHIGRRSGAARQTPIEPFFTRDGVMIPLAFGPGADWCRNIVAAGHCTPTFRGGEFVLTDPTVVRSDVAEARMPADRARASQNAGVQQYLSLRIASPIDAGLITSSPAATSAV